MPNSSSLLLFIRPCFRGGGGGSMFGGAAAEVVDVAKNPSTALNLAAWLVASEDIFGKRSLRL